MKNIVDKILQTTKKDWFGDKKAAPSQAQRTTGAMLGKFFDKQLCKTVLYSQPLILAPTVSG
jgi:hypothetical protein